MQVWGLSGGISTKEGLKPTQEVSQCCLQSIAKVSFKSTTIRLTRPDPLSQCGSKPHCCSDENIRYRRKSQRGRDDSCLSLHLFSTLPLLETYRALFPFAPFHSCIFQEGGKGIPSGTIPFRGLPAWIFFLSSVSERLLIRDCPIYDRNIGGK